MRTRDKAGREDSFKWVGKERVERGRDKAPLTIDFLEGDLSGKGGDVVWRGLKTEEQVAIQL